MIQMTRNSLVKSNEISSLDLTKLSNVKFENKIDDSCNDYANLIKDFKNKIANGICPFVAKLKDNQQYLDQIMEYAGKIPSVDIPSINIDIKVPQFEKIEIEKDDTKEIKDIIRKINRKTQIFTCDHSGLEKKAINYGADALKLRKRSELKIIDDFIKRLAEYCWKIQQKDNRGKEFKMFMITTDDVDKIIEAAMNFSAEVLKFNATYHGLHCSKCEKLMKEYEFTKEDIMERREEIREMKKEEIRKIQEEAEGNGEIVEFMNQYFPGIDRLKISQITKMMKVVKGKMIKNEEIREMLEESEQWRVTNVHNVLYATKI